MKKATFLLLFGFLLLSGCSEDSDPQETSRLVQIEEPCAKDDLLTVWCGYKNPEDLAVLAEGQGFEPWIGYKPMPVFKTGAFNRSATPPTVEEYTR